MSQAVRSRRYTMWCRHRAAAALLLLLLSFYPSGVHTEYTSQSLSMHLDTLLAEYDREVPPTAPAPATDDTETGNSSTPLTVAVSLDVRHASVDDHQSVMRLLADLKMSWNDSRLMWNATEWEASSVLVSGERLWTPDVTLLTAGGGGGAGDAALRARLGCTGGASLVLRLDLSVPIALDLVSWPRDVQEAVFKFASRAHSDDEIQLVIEEYKNVLVVECGAWEVASVSGVASTWSRADGSAASTAEWSVRVARRGAAQAAAAAAVLAACTALLAAALTLPFSRRAPLAACVAFVSAAWLLTAIFHIPGGVSAPRVLSVMCCVCVSGAVCGACAAAAARLARRTAPPPAALRALLSRVSAVYVLASDPEEESGAGGGGAWAALARLTDAAAVAALVATHLALLAVYMLA